MRLSADKITSTGRRPNRVHLVWNNSPFSLCGNCEPELDPNESEPTTIITSIAYRYRKATCRTCRKICQGFIRERNVPSEAAFFMALIDEEAHKKDNAR